MSFQSAHFAVLSVASVDSLSRHLAGAVLSGIWEGVLLALAVGLCLRLFPNITARLRFIVWMAAFAVIAALPALKVLLADHAAGRNASQALSVGAYLQVDPRWSYALGAVWLAASIGRAAHLALQAIRLRALWNSAVPVSTDLLPELSLGTVQLCISSEVDRPSVIGFLAPRILIPAWLFDQLTAGELEQIALHELEHLRRRDDWINLLQKIGLVLFPLNPALFWIDRRLASERELACDDGVLSRTHAPRAYATCLTSLAERGLKRRSRGRLTVLALGAVGAIRRSDFSRRIESILGFGRRSTINPAYSRGLAGLVITGVLGGAITLAHIPQLVSFNDAGQTQPVALTPSAQPVRANHLPAARFENVVYHAQPAAGKLLASRPQKLKLKLKARPATPGAQVDAVYSGGVPREALKNSSGLIAAISKTQIPFGNDKQKKAMKAVADLNQSLSGSFRRVMVLTSWQQIEPQPVLVTLPDGRTFLATYAADPNRAGWLIIQL